MVSLALLWNFRKFGTSKRFSENDKKDMTDTIAYKLQMAHDDWDFGIKL